LYARLNVDDMTGNYIHLQLKNLQIHLLLSAIDKLTNSSH